MNIERKLKHLERKFGIKIGMVPGTVLSRVCLPEGGVGWSLGLGRMSMPKLFFTGKTIKACLKQAEDAVKAGKTEPDDALGILFNFQQREKEKRHGKPPKKRR